MFAKNNRNTGKSCLAIACLSLLLLSVSAAHSPALAQPDQQEKTVSPFDHLKPKAPKSTPVMIIRFNQQNVYFLNPLRQVVGKIDSKKPSAYYELHSVIPVGQKRNPANGKDFDENVRSVITVLGRLAVPPENISVTTETSSAVENQEIHVVVK